ncbi:MAG: Crp/Fnr family transcriptional regulator [Propionibacteriaceae bacterium]|nr:Crp/Fnr family transcriptional regulator [Micropruina sp.]HBX79776.1 transcriptional regulator [Propionibacteriaceae bacterium]HBY22229.1 transcriptional regulator [Propionibacteriaceae bacterium]
MTVAALEAYPLIGGLPGELRRRVVKTGRPFRAEVGSVLFDLDGPCSGFTLILGGLVDVSRPNADGRELLLYHLSRGDTCVLTLGCLLGEGTYPARAVVRETVSGVQLPRTLFREMLDGSPAFRDAMLGMFSRRMTRLVGLLEATAFASTQQRLAGVLLERGTLIRGTHAQLAEAVGTVREVVSRHLAAWADAGWVETGRGWVRVTDPAALRVIAEPLGTA